MTARLLQLLAMAGMVAYPFAVYALAGRVPAAVLAALLLILLALRLVAAGLVRPRRRRHLHGLAIAAALAALGLLAFPVLELRQVRLYPALMSAGFGTVFLVSLWSERPLVERIARAMEGELPAPAIAYTRRVTQLWAAVLFANALVATGTAYWTSLATWTLYNGLLSYLLLGGVFLAEFVVRRRLQRRWEQA